MRQLLSLFLIISTVSFSLAQEETEKQKYSPGIKDWSGVYAETITSNDLRAHLMRLASDEFEGRETAEEGGYKAAEYIRSFFDAIGTQAPKKKVSPSQRYALERVFFNAAMKVNDDPVDYLDQYMFFDSRTPDFSAEEIQFVGFGIESENYNDYAEIGEVGKVVLMVGGEPMNAKGKRYVNKLNEKSEWGNIFDRDRRSQIAAEKGAEVILYVLPGYKTQTQRFRRRLTGSRLGMPKGLPLPGEEEKELAFVYISEDVANELTNGQFSSTLDKINKKGKPLSFTSSAKIEFDNQSVIENTFATNEMAFIPGTDLADEVIVITSHYDHIGKRGDEINNGADDDGSGTVSLLEISQAFMSAVKDGNPPRRSVLFIAFSGEEKGLLGSKYYTDHPVIPLKKTVCNLNIDMVGRTDTLHDSPDYVYIIGADRLSQDLHDVNEQCNADFTNLNLDYTYNDPKDPNRYYYRSDHYNFAKNNVPVIFYFGGTHEDYHQPTDTPDKILYDVLEQRARLVFHTAWQLANQDERIELNPEEETAE